MCSSACYVVCYCFILSIRLFWSKEVTHIQNSTRYGISFFRSGDILHTHSIRLDSQSTRHRKSSTIALIMYMFSYSRICCLSPSYMKIHLVVSSEHTLCATILRALSQSHSVSFHFTPLTVYTAHINTHISLSISHRFTLTCKIIIGVCVCCLLSLSHCISGPFTHTCGVHMTKNVQWNILTFTESESVTLFSLISLFFLSTSLYAYNIIVLMRLYAAWQLRPTESSVREKM